MNDTNDATDTADTNDTNDTAGGTPLYRQPDLYDELYRGFTEDIPFYLELARARPDLPVLELACGSGRVTIPLAEAGVEITGIDLAPEMIAAARQRAAGSRRADDDKRHAAADTQRADAAAALAAESRAAVPRFLVGDMRDPAAALAAALAADVPGGDTAERAPAATAAGPTRFGLVLIPLHSLSHLHETDDILRALRNIGTVLVPGGRLALALHNPDPATLARDPDALFPVEMPADTPAGPARPGAADSSRPAGAPAPAPLADPADAPPSDPARILESTRYDAARQVLHVQWWVDRGEEPDLVEFALRMFFPDELDDLLARAGFEVEERWGWYDHSPFTEESGTQVVVARSRGGGTQVVVARSHI